MTGHDFGGSGAVIGRGRLLSQCGNSPKANYNEIPFSRTPQNPRDLQIYFNSPADRLKINKMEEIMTIIR